ncbi:DUF4113 domain-containing protein [Pseudomonas shahriarae]|uniref:DUF4113 domain-containing protein n=1 Tax=Pseudomonas TaxID=286 RepID=UPI002363A0FB|nr:MULTISPECIES: DUF4113 domain-containing protein [Pseudomonas]MDI3203167.1 DUF4113 domain-containing protein [Pseudomonas shahriarae]
MTYRQLVQFGVSANRRATLRTASVPVVHEWGMRRELKSPSYTTRLDELWTIGAGSSWSR